jgi:hypothetical protein
MTPKAAVELRGEAHREVGGGVSPWAAHLTEIRHCCNMRIRHAARRS